MRGVVTQVFDPIRSTACTTALKNIPETHGLAPSRPSILAIRAHLFCAFRRFPTNAGQSSFVTVKTHPRY